MDQPGLAYPFNLTGTLTNTSNQVIEVTFDFTPKLAGGCSDGAIETVTVRVEPTPLASVNNTTAIICNNENVNIAITTPSLTDGAHTFDVSVSSSDLANTGGTAFAPLTGQTYAHTINGTLVNNSNSVITVTYTITPKLAGCADGPAVQTTVQVEPTPQAVVNNLAPVICNAASVNIQVSSPTASTTPADLAFDITVSSTNAPATSGTAFTDRTSMTFPFIINGTLTNSSDQAVTVTFDMTPKLAGCAAGPVQSVDVIVEPTPTANVTNHLATICNGGTPNIEVSSSTTPSIPADLTFDVSVSLPSGLSGTGDAANGLTGATAPFFLNAGTLTNSSNSTRTATYTITPKLNGCANGPSQVVNVVVEPTPSVSVTNNLTKMCNDGTPNITITSSTLPSIPANLTFDVTVATPGGVTGTGVAANGVLGASAPFSINSGTLNNSNNTFVTVTYTITPKLDGCADGTPETVDVIVEPTPTAVPTNNLPVVCSGGTPDITITSPTVPSVAANLTFDVSVSLPANVSGTGVAGAGITGATAPFSVNTGTLTNSSNSPQTVTYTITPRLSGCVAGPVQVVQVIVEPVPVAIATNNLAAICTGGSPSIDVTSPTTPNTPGDVTFDVVVNLPTGVTGTGDAANGLVGAAAPFSINTGMLVHDNLSNSPLIVTYTITPKLNGCLSGSPEIVNVTVRPIPVGQLDNSVVICSDEAFSYNIQTLNIDQVNQVVSTFTYEVSSSDESTVPTPVTLDRTLATNAPISGTFTNLGGADVQVTYRITPFSSTGACAGDPFDVVVTVRPEPTSAAVTTVEHCSDALSPFVFDLQSIINLTGNGVASKFSYSVSSTNPLAVFPESARTVASMTAISQVYSNYSASDVTITYLVTPYNNAGDCAGTPFELRVIVHPEPVGSNYADPVCGTTLNHDLQTQITNGLPALFTYTVTSDNAGVPPAADRGVASNLPITDVYTNTTGMPADLKYVVTPYNAANPTCAGTPFTYVVTVSPSPVGVDDVKATVCSDVPFSFDPQDNVNAGNAVASTFTWTASYEGALSGPTGGSGAVAMSLHNETNAVLTAQYTVTPTSGPCVGATFTIDVPVNPEPVVDPVLASISPICSSNVSGLNPLGTSNPTGVILATNGVSVAADEYVIALKSQPTDLTGVATTGVFTANSPGPGQSDAIAGDIFRNTTAAQLQVSYTVTPRTGGCQGDAFDIIVPVNPEPVLDDPGFPDVCSSNADNPSTVNIVVGTDGVSVNAAAYQVNDIQYSINGTTFTSSLPTDFAIETQATIMGPFQGNNLVRGDRYSNLSGSAVTVRYLIQARSSQGCLSVLQNYDVVIQPEPVMVPSGTLALCSDVPFGQDLSPAPGSVMITHYDLRGISMETNLIAGGGNAAIGNHPAGVSGVSDLLALDTYTNTSNQPRTVTYTVAPLASGCRGADQQIQFTVNPAPALANLDETVCSNTTAGIVLNTDGVSVVATQYRIVSASADPALQPVLFNPTPRTTSDVNEIAANQFRNPTDNPLTVTYNIAPISGANCFGPQRAVVLTVEPEVTVDPVVVAADICSSTPIDVTLNSNTVPTAGTITLNYQVTPSSGLVSGFVPIQNNLQNGHQITDVLVNNANDVETVTYTVTPVAAGAVGGMGCTGLSADVVISVEPKPKVAIAPTTAAVCEGDAIAFELTTTTVPSLGDVDFFITGNPAVTGSVTGASPDGTLFSHGDFLDDVLDNPTTIAQTVTYVLQPRATDVSCVGDAVHVIVTVNPRPVVTPSSLSEAICSGGNINIALAYDVTNTIGIWTANADASILGASAGAGGLLFQSLFNNSTAPGDVVYTVTPRSPAGCEGTPVDIDVAVDPIPNLTATPTAATICDDGTTSVTLASSVAGATFNWTATPSSSDISGAADDAGSTIAQTLSNDGVIPGSVLYQVTPQGPGATACAGLPQPVIITVAPPVDGSFIGTDAAICLGTPQFLMVQALGQAPFTVVYSDGVNDITKSNVGNVFVEQLLPQETTTYSLVSVTDVNGCEALPADDITITVSETDATFAVVGPASSCSPFTAQFQYDQVAGTSYTWRWFDGSADSVYTATTTEPGKVVKHVYYNASPIGTLDFDVNLIATLDPSLGGCMDIQAQTVTVPPTITPAVFPDKSVICSGETVSFFNQTMGAAAHSWFYRVQGDNSQQLDPRTSINVTYTLTNTSTQNPIVYEIVYRAENGNCPEETVIPITVYRGADVSFTEQVPEFIGGNATVTFTNTTNPLETGDFRYEWSFGLNSNPETHNGADAVIDVDYSMPGSKEIILKVTNINAEADGALCVSEARTIIDIVTPPLVVDFQVSPKAGCFPVEVEVIENNSSGDTFKWQVIDDAGRTAATSNAVKPVFALVNPGTYDIFLEVTNSLTGQFATGRIDGIEVFENPVASIEARPTTLFVPDTELFTFNFTTGANRYLWDFGDGTTTEDFEPTHFYTLEGMYTITLIAANDHGDRDIDGDGIPDGNVVCYDTARREVVARAGGLTKVPNAFTPGHGGPNGGTPGSGFNDVFLPITRGVANEEGAFIMQIFDRWGTLIFESRSQNQGWDGYDRNGNLVPAGVYVYKLDLRLADGQRTTQVGDVTVIR